MVTFKLEGSAELARALREFSRETGRDLATTVSEAAKHVATELNFQTAPRTQGQGQGALAGDVNRVFYSVGKTYRELRAKNARQAAGLWRVAQNTPAKLDAYLNTTDLARLDVGVPDAAIHDAARVQGRVPRSPASARLVIRNKASLSAYVKKRQKSVGAAKASWAHAAQAISGRSVRGPERWANVGAHKRVSGTARLTGQDGANPQVELISRIPYIAALLSRSGISAALKSGAIRLEARARILLEKCARRV